MKPPRSVFAPPPTETREGELLVEADRDVDRSAWVRDEKIKHWWRCLATAKNRDGTFAMAGVIYKRKYGEYPGDDFPCVPPRDGWRRKISESYPEFGKRRSS